MATPDDGSARGLFSSPSNGRSFNRYRKRKSGALDRFAAELAKHIDEADLDASEILATGEPLLPNARPDLGGDAGECAMRIGCRRTQGGPMLQRIRRRLGWQAI